MGLLSFSGNTSTGSGTPTSKAHRMPSCWQIQSLNSFIGCNNTDRGNIASDQRKILPDQRKIVSDHGNIASDQRNILPDQRKIASDQRNIPSFQRIIHLFRGIFHSRCGIKLSCCGSFLCLSEIKPTLFELFSSNPNNRFGFKIIKTLIYG